MVHASLWIQIQLAKAYLEAGVLGGAPPSRRAALGHGGICANRSVESTRLVALGEVEPELPPLRSVFGDSVDEGVPDCQHRRLGVRLLPR